MKIRNLRIVALILVFVLLLVSSGCNNYSTITPEPGYPINFEMSTEKEHYEYGEEITIELLFSPNSSDSLFYNYTYCVKLIESPYFEVIGDSVVYSNRLENGEKIRGKWGYYEHRVTFKIKVYGSINGDRRLHILIGCVDDDWLSNYYWQNSSWQSWDDEFPFTPTDGHVVLRAHQEGGVYIYAGCHN